MSADDRDRAAAESEPALAAEVSGPPADAPAEARADSTDEASALRERLAGLERELAAERERATDYMQKWQRAQADHANFRRRAQQEQEQFLSLATAQTMALLLPALDSLERAFRTLPESLQHLTWVEGIALVDLQLRRTLDAQGVTAFEPRSGDALDPARHQAIAQTETTQHAEGTIVAVVQRGYEQQGGRVLRPALVSVARAPSPATTSGNGPPGDEAGQPGPEPESAGA
jgi:molecular chaperone GrpE